MFGSPARFWRLSGPGLLVSVGYMDPGNGATDTAAGSTSGTSLLSGIGLLAAGRSSTFADPIAGQGLMEGFLDLKIPCWQRRVIARGLAVVPAFRAVARLGEGGIGALLMLSLVRTDRDNGRLSCILSSQ